MKSRILASITAITLFALLAIPVQLAAQHAHYKLIDMGTLGGPNSFLSGPGTQVLNNRGTFAGISDTASANPNPGCYLPLGNAPDCFVENPIVWKNGAVATLPVLSGGNNSRLDQFQRADLQLVRERGPRSDDGPA